MPIFDNNIFKEFVKVELEIEEVIQGGKNEIIISKIAFAQGLLNALHVQGYSWALLTSARNAVSAYVALKALGVPTPSVEEYLKTALERA